MLGASVHAVSIQDPSLFLIDRGFYSIRLFADVRRRGHHFLTRMRSSGRPKLLRRLGPGDGLYEIRPGNSWGTLPPDVPERMTVRIVDAQWKGFRPVRVVTSLLDPDAVPRAELLDLYHTIVIRPGRRFERDKQKRRAASRSRKLEALKEKEHAA